MIKIWLTKDYIETMSIRGDIETYSETFEKCSILPAQLNLLKFNRGSSSRKAKILTTPVRSAGPTGQAGIH